MYRLIFVVFFGSLLAVTLSWLDMPFKESVYNLLMHLRGIHGSLLPNQEIIASSPWITHTLTFVVSIAATALLFISSPMLGILAVILLLVSLILMALMALNVQIYIDIVRPLFAIGLAYYFLIPYRLIIEYKGRWKYQQENRMLSEVETLKNNFMSLVSHNLKSPIARIQGAIETLLESQELSQSKIAPELYNILRSTEDLDQLVSRILSLTRIEHSEYQLKMENRDINAVIESVVQAYRTRAKEKQVRIETKYEPLFPLLMDIELVKESIQNLIDNAVKYTPENGIITIKTQESAGWVVIQIKDTGIGIPETDRAMIFSKFFRAANVKNKGVRGSGLGLYLVKYFIERHGGMVTVESVEHTGSIFSIYLPIK